MSDVGFPRGFSAVGTNAGIKNRKRDFGLLVSDRPASFWAMTTTNRCRAHPIARTEALRARGGAVRAIAATSGAANALTGPAGAEDDRVLADGIARALDVDPSEVLTAATGVIGHRLPVERVLSRLPAAVAELGPAPDGFAEAILTTDRAKKIVVRDLFVGGQKIRLHAIAKGAGMIAPELATTLCFITTDAAMSGAAIKLALESAVETTLNQLTVDGDMSTNDCVIMLANGAAGNEEILADDPAAELIARALTELLGEVAQRIAKDGEGSTRAIRVEVSGAGGHGEARAIAIAIADSLLVKAAIFGADAGAWGRVMAAAGAAASFVDAELDLGKVTLALQGVVVFKAGEPVPIAKDGPLRHRMSAPEVVIELDLGAGSGRARAYGCDLGYDYVKINADYLRATTTEAGTVGVNERLQELGPSIKKKLLIEALRYIERFRGRRAVIAFGGVSAGEPRLLEELAEDVVLLESVGLRPVVVLGDQGEDAPELVDRLVVHLNQRGNKGVGLSGRDGALLRARRGRDLADFGTVESVDPTLLEMLERAQRIPVVSPTGIDEGGDPRALRPEQVAAELAVALASEKLVFLTEWPGVLDGDELISEISADRLRRRLDLGEVESGLVPICEAALRALRNGVKSVHVLDGRVPHTLIAELFTDRGAGTLIREL